jgi:small subunit ribosomal protein S6
MHPRRYETLILLAPNLEPGGLEAFKNKVDGILSAGEGQLVRFEDWGRRRLAYPVQRELFGYYLLYDFQGSPALAAELERNLKIDEKVFKYLTLVLDRKFTAEDLAAAREKLLAEAARREAEKARREASDAGTEAGPEGGAEDLEAGDGTVDSAVDNVADSAVDE